MPGQAPLELGGIHKKKYEFWQFHKWFVKFSLKDPGLFYLLKLLFKIFFFKKKKKKKKKRLLGQKYKTVQGY